MKRLLLTCVLMATATGAWAQDCVVNDPTGTPLNVRAEPNGQILGALHNGAMVRIVETTADGRWAYIEPVDAGQRGWVFRQFLVCQ